MNIITIIETIALILIFLGITLLFIVNAIKNKWISKIIDTLKASIRDAEKIYGPKQGKLKLQYVLNNLKHKCEELGIPYNLLEKLFIKLIENKVDGYNTFTKKK